MTLYWPNATYIDKHTGEEERLFTYDAALSYDKAKEQIKLWQTWYHYNIVKAWIEICQTENNTKTIENIPIGETHVDGLEGV